MNQLKKVWTVTAKLQLKAIYQYHRLNSLQSANLLKSEILQATKEIYFVEQYQQDEIEPEFRRIFIRNYKILYFVGNETIIIARIFNSNQNPAKQIQ